MKTLFLLLCLSVLGHSTTRTSFEAIGEITVYGPRASASTEFVIIATTPAMGADRWYLPQLCISRFKDGKPDLDQIPCHDSFKRPVPEELKGDPATRDSGEAGTEG